MGWFFILRIIIKEAFEFFETSPKSVRKDTVPHILQGKRMRIFKALFVANGLIGILATLLFASDWSPFQGDALIFTIPLIFYLSLWSYLTSAPSPEVSSEIATVRRDTRITEVLESCVGMPVIVLWADDNIRVGFVKEVCDRSLHVIPSLIVKDYITGQEVSTVFGATYLFTPERLKTFANLTRRERNAFGRLAFDTICTTEPYASKGQDRLSHDAITQLLKLRGFYGEYQNWVSEQLLK